MPWSSDMGLSIWLREFYSEGKKKATAITATLLFITAAAEAGSPDTTAGFDATIPVLDMDEYFNPETKQAFVKKLYDALKNVGFFAVVNSGVDVQILDRGYQACFDFFALPQATKMALFDPAASGQRGYVPGESPKGQSRRDFKEFYHVGRELDEQQQTRLNFWKNIWPQEFNLKDPLFALFKALEEYMVPLEQAMAEAIGEPSDLFSHMTKEGDVLLRAIHYPATPPKNTLWAAEHTDIDLFTILPRATAQGLQLRNADGEWIDVKVPEHAFIVNAGDIHSGRHRVVAKNDGYERYSVVFFVHPRSEDRLDPLPSCIARTGGIRRYANANRLELLEERLVDLGLASYPMMKHLADSGLMERLIEVGRASPKAMKKLQQAGLASDQVLQELDFLKNDRY
jgi:isopenicillin N synthase-like dioxygenase